MHEDNNYLSYLLCMSAQHITFKTLFAVLCTDITAPCLKTRQTFCYQSWMSDFLEGHSIQSCKAVVFTN